MMQRSSDAGKTWSEPQVVVDDKQIIQSQACVDANGKIWLVYVQSIPNWYERSGVALWLTSSSDGGKTWAVSARVTDGKHLDRDPDIIFHDGKLLVAFSRTTRGANTNIWLAEIDPKLQ